MGRLPLSGSKMKKIKYGTTVLETTPKKIDELRRKNPESIRSTGEAIDYLCNCLQAYAPICKSPGRHLCQGDPTHH